MKYKEAADYLNSLNVLGSVLGLDSIKELLKRLDNPQDKLKIIHIAGTNGKGSVGAFLSYILMDSGMKVGRYVSPAVKNPLEIIQINNSDISENKFAKVINDVREACVSMQNDGFPHPTRFEIETAAAYLFFFLEECDICLVECGLGGDLDATNAISYPLCSIITSISIDHTAFLGSTIEEITAHKAGIIKAGAPVICLKTEPAFSVIKTRAAKLDSQCIAVEPDRIEIVKADPDGIIMNYNKHRNIILSMCGLYQTINCALALECIDFLIRHNYSISDKNILNGIKNTRWFGRFQILSENPYFIIDGAHNPDGAKELYNTICTYFPDRKITFIMGVFADKDYLKILEIVSPIAKNFITIETPGNNRALSAKTLADCIKKYYDIPVVSYESIDAAINDLKNNLSENDIFVAFGSLSNLARIEKLYKR